MLAVIKAHPTRTALLLVIVTWYSWEPVRDALPPGSFRGWVLLALMLVSVGAIIRVLHDVTLWLLEASVALSEKREREKAQHLSE